MALPTSRQEFVDHCFRRLGEPVNEVHITEEQADDIVDEALKYYWDYHFNGMDKAFFKHIVTAGNRGDAVFGIRIDAAGTGYANTDTLTLTSTLGSGAAASLTTDANGAITAVTMTDHGDAYAIAPDVTITTSTGSGATLTAELGGFIPVPENIKGVVRVFPLGSAESSTSNMFNIRYQIALNDMYTLMSNSIVPYFSAMQHIGLLEDLLVGKYPIRYNRHRDRLFIDMDWEKATVGEVMLVEAHEIIDPDVFTDAWSDRWLLRYACALMKEQWGTNLKTYQGVMLPGGIQLDGQTIFSEGLQERKDLEAEMVNNFSMPPMDFIGGFAAIGLSLPVLYNILQNVNSYQSLML